MSEISSASIPPSSISFNTSVMPSLEPIQSPSLPPPKYDAYAGQAYETNKAVGSVAYTPSKPNPEGLQVPPAYKQASSFATQSADGRMNTAFAAREGSENPDVLGMTINPDAEKLNPLAINANQGKFNSLASGYSAESASGMNTNLGAALTPDKAMFNAGQTGTSHSATLGADSEGHLKTAGNYNVKGYALSANANSDGGSIAGTKTFDTGELSGGKTSLATGLKLDDNANVHASAGLARTSKTGTDKVTLDIDSNPNNMSVRYDSTTKRDIGEFSYSSTSTSVLKADGSSDSSSHSTLGLKDEPDYRLFADSKSGALKNIGLQDTGGDVKSIASYDLKSGTATGSVAIEGSSGLQHSVELSSAKTGSYAIGDESARVKFLANSEGDFRAEMDAKLDAKTRLTAGAAFADGNAELNAGIAKQLRNGGTLNVGATGGEKGLGVTASLNMPWG